MSKGADKCAVSNVVTCVGTLEERDGENDHRHHMILLSPLTDSEIKDHKHEHETSKNHEP